MVDDPINSRYGRLHGEIDYPHLRQRSVLCLGQGSMGQPVCEQLVRHGVGTVLPGRVRLVDGDVVESRNLIGTGYRECHLGIPKAQAAADILREIDTNVNVSYWHQLLDETHIEQVMDMARQSDLVVLAADDVDLMLKISKRCQPLCSVVMAVFGARVDTAEVGFSIPRQTPSLAVTMGQRERRRLDQPTALGCDTAYVCSFVAGLCLRLLLGDRTGSELFPCYANAPLFLLGLRRTWIFEQQPDDVVRSIINVASSQ